jgi:hypothetical protein
MGTKSRREILAEAFDESENEGTENLEPKAAGEEETPAATDETTPDTGTEATGQQPPKEGKEKPPVKEPTADEKEAAAAREQGKPPVRESVRTDSTLTRAPNSWKPTEREDWAKAPASIRAAVLRREKEIEQALGETNNIRKFSNELANIIQPHVAILQEQRTTPLAAINSLMTTAAGLYRGNQEQKANLVAQIIANYGVDIKTLDAVLSKQPIPPQQQNQPNPNAIPPWAQPVFQFMTEAQRAKQQREQYMQAEANAEIEQAQAEMPFFDDLRNDMADLMEMAANRGRTLDMKGAYALAVAANPEIKKIVDQRTAAARQSAGISQTKRAAASSVRGSPVGEGGASKGAKGNSRRAALEAAWDAAAE